MDAQCDNDALWGKNVGNQSCIFQILSSQTLLQRAVRPARRGAHSLALLSLHLVRRGGDDVFSVLHCANIFKLIELAIRTKTCYLWKRDINVQLVQHFTLTKNRCWFFFFFGSLSRRIYKQTHLRISFILLVIILIHTDDCAMHVFRYCARFVFILIFFCARMQSHFVWTYASTQCGAASKKLEF